MFAVNVTDLTYGSNAEVEIMCDYCGNKYTIKWEVYNRIHKRCIVDTDCCKDCLDIKAKESVSEKYGCFKNMYLMSNNKRKSTNLNRYGSENVFGGTIIKEKIVRTNLQKYGVEYSQQSQDVRMKTINTCREKYGVDNYVELFKGKFIGENSPVWKGGAEHSRVERATHDYNAWRKEVFSRDSYTCVKCGAKNARGNSSVELNAHHILNWKDNEWSRYDVDNGVTLCSNCHIMFHSMFGKHNNTLDQFNIFLLDKKIC